MDNRMEQYVGRSVAFINRMAGEGIAVEYQAYNSLDFNPPFHGRYWINNNLGYIVDGSLNTYGRGRIFAQKMDEENYRIIRDLFDGCVMPNAEPYKPLNSRGIFEMHNILMGHFQP